jgi:hypothetical protein
VDGVLEAPLAFAGLKTTAPEPAHASLTKLPPGCLDGTSSLGVEPFAALGRQLAGHALGLRQALRDAASGRVSVLAGGDHKLDAEAVFEPPG